MNAWKCDSCDFVSQAGDADDPPEDWRFVTLPVRGVQGARSTRDGVICGGCDNSLYEWLNADL